MLFQERLNAGDKLTGAAVGSGMASHHLLAGGADFLLIATGGRFRTAGVSSLGSFLPMGNANDMIFEPARREILTRAGDKPVIIGFCPTDPTHDWRALLEKARDAGFHGVNNYPSIGFYDGPIRQALEKAGFSYEKEVEFLAEAARLGLFTFAFVYSEEEAGMMAQAGVDAVCANLNLPVGSDTTAFGCTTPEDAAFSFNRMFRAAEKGRPGLFRMFYVAGPISTPENLDKVMQETGADGYMGGSVFERLPSAAAMEEIAGQYKKLIHLSHENKELRRELQRKKGFDEIVGQSSVMQDLYEVVSKVADKDVNVLITGESGTGKELVVKAIHYNSARRNQPFIKVNCAAIPEALLESELFGHTKGAFTGAMEDRIGLFQLADKGTIFLDEIGELSMGTQAKLLRVIQQRELTRVGSDRVVKLDFRLIAATNVDLQESVLRGKFREDLYYRLNVVSIRTPALRDHMSDIPLLITFFLRRIAAKFEQPPCRVAAEALDALQRYSWPGNVRELEHALESASVLCSDFLIRLKHLPLAIQDAAGARAPGPSPRESGRFLPSSEAKTAMPDLDEREKILSALASCGWRREQAAKILGVSRKTLYNKMRKYNITTG
ncbi:MAG: phosphoenolpyruvate hydrolase family protein [Planctomycetota bacterium]|nr:phosphoenolpyruvate hydrolase family protein [Planctomycetota bacterium]